MHKTRVVFVLSGKRKSGKDYIGERLLNLVGAELCSIIRLSAPLKYQYAKENGLDYQMLLSSSQYKEQYRDDMIKWGEEKRNTNPNYFCDLASAAGADSFVWIVTDARRPTDLSYFQKMDASVYLIRIEADNEVRKVRGWKFVHGVDDCDSECALDQGINWDYKIVNNGQAIDHILRELVSKCKDHLL